MNSSSASCQMRNGQPCRHQAAGWPVCAASVITVSIAGRVRRIVTEQPPGSERIVEQVADPSELIMKNRAWAKRMLQDAPGSCQRLASQQAPRYLWIGCADSRVSANVITGLDPGEVFVHRNIANVVPHTDLNVLSVLEFAVKVLRVEHVIVCGHYGCGGIDAALDHEPHGLLDSGLRHIKDVAARHEEELLELTDRQHRAARLCELN